MNKLYNALRYIFFFPISILFSILISGIVSVVQNFTNMFFCKFAIYIPFGICNNNFNNRTFLAEIIGLYILLISCYYIVPNYKELIVCIISFFCFLTYLFSFCICFYTKQFYNLSDIIVCLFITLIMFILFFKIIKEKENEK